MDIIDRITIIGVGLMGGSLGLGLKRAGYIGCITGFGSSAGTLEAALQSGALDRIGKSYEDAVHDADLIVVAAPLGKYEEVFSAIAPYLKHSAIVTDIGSVKCHVMETATSLLPESICFIGGHPMAGSEKSGIKAASPLLYENAYFFMCPEKHAPKEAVEKLKALIVMLKAYPVVIDAETHDNIVAKISHLPQITAAALVQVLQGEEEIGHMTFAGGGFRDTTRIASSEPGIWKDILIYNRSEVLKYVQRLETKLGEFKEILSNGSGDEILDFFGRSKAVRDQLPARVRSNITRLYEISISVEDRPGILGNVTCLLGNQGVNIKEIEVLHSRDREEGAIRLAFDTVQAAEKALVLLEKENYKVTFFKGEV